MRFLVCRPRWLAPLKLTPTCDHWTGEDCGCSRRSIILPASGLQIGAQLSKGIYRPGEVARTRSHGHGLLKSVRFQAALGHRGVDESVSP